MNLKEKQQIVFDTTKQLIDSGVKITPQPVINVNALNVWELATVVLLTLWLCGVETVKWWFIPIPVLIPYSITICIIIYQKIKNKNKDKK